MLLRIAYLTNYSALWNRRAALFVSILSTSIARNRVISVVSTVFTLRAFNFGTQKHDSQITVQGVRTADYR